MECCNNNMIMRGGGGGSAVVPRIPSSSFGVYDSHFPLPFKLPRIKRHNSTVRQRQQRLVVRNASAGGFDQNVNGLPLIPGIFFKEEAIGAEYGEGFETFRHDGPLKVDVDFLNDRVQQGWERMRRYAMKPDEAFGLIFSWDNVVADTRALKLSAWKQLAYEEGKSFPEDANTLKQMLYSSPDRVLTKILSWRTTEDDANTLKLRLSQLFYENLVKLDKPMEGLQEWLQAVSTACIPCAVVSSLDRRTMVEALERMGIKKYFKTIVSEEDGMDALAHRFLSAAVNLDRKPSKCVVFEDDPRGVAAAHNCTMMAVALIGAHPAYNLVQADLAVANFSDLSVINLRRLYAHKGPSFMDLQKQIIEKSPPKRRLTTDTVF